MPVVDIDALELPVRDLWVAEDDETPFGLFDSYSLIFRPDCMVPDGYGGYVQSGC